MADRSVTTIEELGQKKLDKAVNDAVSRMQLQIEFRLGKRITFGFNFLKWRLAESDSKAERKENDNSTGDA